MSDALWSLLGALSLTSPVALLLVKATLILLLAVALTRVMATATAGARHLVWLATLGALVLVPVLTAWAPIRVPILGAAPAAPAAPPASRGPSTDYHAAPGPRPTGVEPVTPAARASAAGEAPGSARRAGGPMSVATMLKVGASAWLAVVLAILLSLAVGMLRVRQIIRRGATLEERDWRDPLWEIADRVGIDDAPRLVRSEDVKMPFACGLLSPTIVVPAEADGWTLDRRRAVLLHELAHIRRRDILGHMLGRLVCAVYWFHPLVWAAAKQLRAESERACDDLALACGARPADYAEHLLDIVSSVRGDRTPAVAVAMARRQEFEGRMLAILNPDLPHGLPGRGKSAAIVGVLSTVMLFVGAAVPTRRADAAPAAADASQIVRRPLVTGEIPRDEPQSEWGGPEKATRKDKAGDKYWKDGYADADAEARADAAAESAAIARVEKRMEARSSVSRMDAMAVPADERPGLLANVLRRDASAQLRRVAAWGLAEYASEQVAADALAFALRNDADARVREMAAWALGDGDGDSRATIDALGAAARGDADVSVRSTAVWALGSIGDRSGLAAVLPALADANVGVRMRAAWAVGSIEPREAPPQLVALLRDPDKRVRSVTAWALYTIEDPATATALSNALKSESDRGMQILYVRAIASLGERSVDAIRGLLDSPDPEIKATAVRALAGGDASGPWPWPWPEPRPHP